jgi:colanic acid/amylovoran biosynthesis glycosyltransferase
MEAMASRVPVISTSTGGIRELVEDGMTGFLVEERNAPALADKLRSLWEDPATVDKVAAGARMIIDEQYNVQTLNQILTKILTAVIYERCES